MKESLDPLENPLLHFFELIATGTPPPTINYAFSSVRASSLDMSGGGAVCREAK